MLDRDADPEFDADEVIYRRVPGIFLHGNEVLPHAFDWPAPSVLRSKYSQPSHALNVNCCDDKPLQAGTWAIAKIKISDMPTPMQTGDKGLLHFLIAHRPLLKCYAHCEIKCRKEGDPENQLRDRPTGKLRDIYLVELSKIAVIAYGPVALT